MANDFRVTRLVKPENIPQATSAPAPTPAMVPRASDPPIARLRNRPNIDETRPFQPSNRPATAQLKIYFDDQQGFENYRLCTDRTVIGRTTGEITVPYDPMVAEPHAEIVREQQAGGWKWRLRDLGSEHGTFARVHGARLSHGDELMLGQARYRFLIEHGTAILQHLKNGLPHGQMQLPSDGFCLGREQHHLLDAFWDDQLDSKHALLAIDRFGDWTIKNLQSVNGVWYRVSELALFARCYFQLGEQRFGFQV